MPFIGKALYTEKKIAFEFICKLLICLTKHSAVKGSVDDILEYPQVILA